MNSAIGEKIPNFENEVLAEYLNPLSTREDNFESGGFQYGGFLIRNMENFLIKK